MLFRSGNVVKISDGNLKLTETWLLFDGAMNIATKAMDVNLELELQKSRHNAVRVGIRRQIESGLKQLGAKKYADPEKLTDVAMKPLLNKNGRVYMKFRIDGTVSKPDATLTFPALGSIGDIIKQVAGDVILEAGKEAGKKAAEDGAKQLIKKVPKIKLF